MENIIKRTLVTILIIGLLILFGYLIYYSTFSEKAKLEKELNNQFKDCIGNIGENYCHNISKEYKYIIYQDFGYDFEHPFLDKPTQIVCRDFRECCGIERYYILNEEISKCKEELKP